MPTDKIGRIDNFAFGVASFGLADDFDKVYLVNSTIPEERVVYFSNYCAAHYIPGVTTDYVPNIYLVDPENDDPQTNHIPFSRKRFEPYALCNGNPEFPEFNKDAPKSQVYVSEEDYVGYTNPATLKYLHMEKDQFHIYEK